MDLDGKLSRLKMSIGSCSMHNSQCLEDTSTCTTKSEASAHIYGTVDIQNELAHADYDSILHDDSGNR